MVRIHNSLQPICETEIRQVEERLGIRLPHDYENFLLLHNGGQPDPQMFSIQGCGQDDHATASFFFGIGGDENIDLEANRRIYQGRVPSDILPIASDPGGNLLCISVSGKNDGKLYFWTHEEESLDGDLPTYENLYFVANNINELLANLM
jgi:hypothetical protein